MKHRWMAPALAAALALAACAPTQGGDDAASVEASAADVEATEGSVAPSESAAPSLATPSAAPSASEEVEYEY